MILKVCFGFLEMNALKKITYFASYEEREEAFGRSVFNLIPRKYAGVRRFWQDFRDISLIDLEKLINPPIAYVTSNPRDCLAFGSPFQVLHAACLRGMHLNRNHQFSPEALAEEFGIRGVLNQPIRTLSGGESVKLALAKSMAAGRSSQKLAIASPFSWLSQENSHYLEHVVAYYQGLGLPVELFALEGEDNVEPASGVSSLLEQSEKISFRIKFDNARIILGSTMNTLGGEVSFARVRKIDSVFCSPCLLIGSNGQGKSLVAKALSKAVGVRGFAEVDNPKNNGKSRLLFQDAIKQTLLRSFDALGGSVDCGGDDGVIDIYDSLRGELEKVDYGLLKGTKALSTSHIFRSLFEVKLMLVAARLCGDPASLILDEPDWGLSKASAIAFVIAIIRIAHNFGIPVVLISHKPWWKPLARSILLVEKRFQEADKERNCLFEIRMQKQDPVENELEN